MRIELSGATVCVIGRIRGWSKEIIANAVEATGGTLVGMPKEGCLVLVGSNPSWYKLDRARARVCTILEGDDALELLEHGELEPADQPTRRFGELVAQARALFDQRPSLEVFASLTAFLDDCPPEHQHDLADYIAPQLAGWGPVMLSHAYARNIPDRYAWLHTGRCADAGGSMRTMPNRWVIELMKGGPAPKHRVCDTLSFTAIETSSALAANIFEHGPLEHLRAFSPGRSEPRYRKAVPFYRRMVKSDALIHVDTFTFLESSASAFDVVMKHPDFLPNLTTLHLDSCTWRLDDAASLASCWSDQLETLRVSRMDHILWLRDHRRELTALDDLIIELPSHGDQHIECLPIVAEGIGSLTLASYKVDYLLPAIDALASRPPDGLRVLDLSPTNNPRTCREEPSERLARSLIASGFCSRLERVVLNASFHDSLRVLLEAEGALVEVLPVQ